MENNLKPYKHLDEWIPLSKVVDMALVDDWDDAQALRQRFNHWGIRGYRKLNLNLLRIVKTVLLEVSRLGTAHLPDDFSKVISAGYYDVCGDYVPQIETGLMEVKPEHKCTCKTCNDKGLCNAIQYEKTEVPIVINGEHKTNIIIRTLDKSCGVYKEQREEWFWVQESGTVQKRTINKDLCTLETLSCGCISESENNVVALKSCGCCGVWQYYGNTNNCSKDDYFAIDEKNRLIHVGTPGVKWVRLKYRAHLPCVNGEVYVPAVATECLVAYILYKRDQRRKGLAQNQKDGSYLAYKRERRELRKNLFPIRLDVIRNALNLVPYG